MKGYLLDSNHVSAVVRPISPLRERIGLGKRKGIRFGTIIPVICELMAGLQSVARRDEFRRAYKRLLSSVRLWPLDLQVAQHYGDIFQGLKRKGRSLSQVDVMLAALARHMDVTILTSDKDFEALPDIRTENWLG